MKKFLNEIYVVKKTDTIESIAEKYNVKSITILIKNNISPKMLKEGMVLFINNNH